MEASKIYDLEERTYKFAMSCRFLVQKLPKTILNIQNWKQLIQFSGYIAAKYIEANEKLGNKDFELRLTIASKKTTEPMIWLKMLHEV